MKYRFKTVFLFSIFILAIAYPAYSINRKSERLNTVEKNKLRNARLFTKAIIAKNLGDIAKAERLYLECLKFDANDAASMYELATIYLSSKRIDDAQKYALKASQLSPENNYYKILLANVYLSANKADESSKILKALAKKYPQNYNYLKQLAYIYMMDKDYNEAIKILNLLEDKSGVNEMISMQKQQLYLSVNKPDSAILEIERLIKEFPYETKYYALMAELSIQNKKDEKALWAYQQIAKIDPNDTYIHISLFDYYRKRDLHDKAFEELKLSFANPKLGVETKLQILLSYYSAQEIYTTHNEKARELIWLLLETHPENIRAMSLKADLLYRAKEYEEARDLLKKVLQQDSTQYSLHELLLIIEADLLHWKEMAEFGNLVIERFPQEPLPYLISGLGNIQLDNYKEAEDKLSKGVRLVFNNPKLKGQFYSYLGDLYHEQDKIEKSYKSYDQALQYDSTNSLVLNNYAYYLAMQGEKLDLADKMSEKAVELDPDNSSNIDTRAWVLYKLGRYNEALKYIEQAYKLDGGENVELVEHYGDILFRLGEKKRAVKLWKKARDIGGGSKYLEQKITEKRIVE